MIGKRRDVNYKRYREYRLNYNILYKWMFCELYGRTIEDELLKRNIHTIAIYGAGELGGLLWNKLKKSSIKVAYIIDTYSEAKHYDIDDIEIIRPSKVKKKNMVDLIIVSYMPAINAILRTLDHEEIRIPVISIEDFIMRM